MEPVQLPKVITPVMQTERVKRAKPRENRRGGAGFGRYLHRGRRSRRAGRKKPRKRRRPLRMLWIPSNQ